ncbi:MAG: phage major capsid protein [Pseudomonadota bacterium]
MNRLAELRQALAAKKAEGMALIEQHEAGTMDKAAYDAAYPAIEAEVTRLTAELASQEALAEARRTMQATTSTPALSIGTDEPNPETTAGFKDMAEFATAVRFACNPHGQVVDNRLSTLAATPQAPHQGGGSAGEGYLLPPEYRDQLWELMLEEDTFIQRTDYEPTDKREVKHPVDESTPWGTSGIQAYWQSEGVKMNASRQSTDGRSLPLNEIYVLVEATEELLEDAPRMASRLGAKSAQRINWKIDEGAHFGNGAGRPQGWFASKALVEVAKESGQAAGTLTVANLSKMYSRFIRVPGDTPLWIANSAILPQLIGLTIGNQPVWVPGGSINGAPDGTIFGAPVMFTEHAKALGAKGDISLVSPRGYHALRRSSGPQFAVSMHLLFDYNMRAFRWVFRMGGQPHLSKPVSPQNGSDTKSHFVTLGART